MSKKKPTRKQRKHRNSLSTLISLQSLVCTYCSCKLVPVPSGALYHRLDHCTVDHVVPTGAGGSDDLYNKTLACYECNYRKGDRPLSVFCEEWTMDIDLIQARLNRLKVALYKLKI